METQYIDITKSLGKDFYVASRLPLGFFEFDGNDELFDCITGKESQLTEILEPLYDAVVKEKYDTHSQLNYLYNTGRVRFENLYSNAHRFYNLLSDDLFRDEPVIKRFKEFLKESLWEYSSLFEKAPEAIWVRPWINILDRWEYLQIHSHTSLYVCDSTQGVTFCCGYDLSIPKPETYTLYGPIYNEFTLFNEEHVTGEFQKENSNGHLTCFPSFLPHTTSPNKSTQKRYTIAMDVITTYDQYHLHKRHGIFCQL